MGVKRGKRGIRTASVAGFLGYPPRALTMARVCMTVTLHGPDFVPVRVSLQRVRTAFDFRLILQGARDQDEQCLILPLSIAARR